MRKKFLNVKGFTLIEIIASLMILVIVGALVIISTIKILQGFAFTKMNTETSQKGHIALDRLTKEFTNIICVLSGDPISISFTSRNYLTGPPPTNRGVWKRGNTIRIGNGGDINTDNGAILVDNVNDFVLTYYDDYVNMTNGNGISWDEDTSKEIEITLSLVGANDNVSVFTTRVAPRNLDENENCL